MHEKVGKQAAAAAVNTVAKETATAKKVKRADRSPLRTVEVVEKEEAKKER